MRGRKPWNYKGQTTNDQGYVLKHEPNHPYADHDGYVREHRLVVERTIGRNLHKWEIVHHINEVRSDNRPENLIIFNTSTEHLKFHREVMSSAHHK